MKTSIKIMQLFSHCKRITTVEVFLTGFFLCVMSFSGLVMSCSSQHDSKNPSEQPQKLAQQQNTTPEHEPNSSITLTDEQQKVAGISYCTLSERELGTSLKVNGLLDVPPQNLVSISLPLGGYVVSTSLLQGMRVQKGQIIATVSNPEFIQIQQDYLETKSKVEFAKLEFERQRDLAKDSINSRKTFQQAKSNYDGLLAVFSGLREKLLLLGVEMKNLEKGEIKSSISLRSPITGYVTKVNVSIGKYVPNTDVLFEIVDTEHVHAELTVFERDILKIKVGQTVHFKLANETTERTAEVHLIGREISPDRTVRVHCHLHKEDKNMLPGTFITAFIQLGKEKVLTLPSDAVYDYLGKKYIFYRQTSTSQHPEKSQNSSAADKESKGVKFLIQEIQAGAQEDGYVHVVIPDELRRPGIQFVYKGGYTLLSGLKGADGGDDHGH